MTHMADVSDVSDTPPRDTPSPIAPIDRISARRLARNTAAILRAVTDEGHSFAIEHFGRVIGFLVPREGRVAVRRRGKVVYEVPEPEPLLELGERDIEILRILHRDGPSVPDRLIPPGEGFTPTAIALARLEITKPPLIRKGWMGYRLTSAGARRAEELGL